MSDKMLDERGCCMNTGGINNSCCAGSSPIMNQTPISSCGTIYSKKECKCNLCKCLSVGDVVTFGTVGGFLITGTVIEICHDSIIKLGGNDLEIRHSGCCDPSKDIDTDGPIFLCCEDIIFLTKEHVI